MMLIDNNNGKHLNLIELVLLGLMLKILCAFKSDVS